MKRLCALLVIAALVFPNCAARGPALAAQRVADPPELWRAYAEKLPIGSIVRIRASDGDHFRASLLVVDGTGVTVKPSTRVSEPVRHLAFDRLEQLGSGPLNGGPGFQGAAIGVGLASGIGAIFGPVRCVCALGGRWC